MAEIVNVGILGKGTVGGAFRKLLEERAEMVEEVSGRRPKVTGVLSSDRRATSTRSWRPATSSSS